MVKELATYLRGWLAYFGDCQTPSVLQSLERWLRRRLRSVVWKQWKRGRTRFRELRKRGVSQDLAPKSPGVLAGPWRLANSPALHIALPNAYFAELGIPPPGHGPSLSFAIRDAGPRVGWCGRGGWVTTPLCRLNINSHGSGDCARLEISEKQIPGCTFCLLHWNRDVFVDDEPVALLLLEYHGPAKVA